MRKSLSHMLCLLAVLLVAGVGSANAALVTDSNKVFFQFDLSEQGSISLFGASFYCDYRCGYDVEDPDTLAGGASVLLDFGTALGGNDFGSAYLTNFGTGNAFNMWTYLRASKDISSKITVDIDALVETLFVTVRYLDDEVFVDRLMITGYGDRTLKGEEVNAATPVNGPETLGLMVIALAGLRAVWKRRA